MAETSVRFVCCLLALTTALSLSMVGPATAGVPTAGATSGVDGVHAVEDPRRPSAGPLFSNMPPSPDTDNTVTRIQVHPNGTATWTLQIRTRLETDTETREYRAFQERFRNNTSDYLGSFSESITTIVGNAEQATGRPMNATGFEASTSIQTVPRQWGVVTYRFTWRNFARMEGDRVVVGDIFQGGYLIAQNDTLVVAAPSNYHVAAVEPAPNERGDGTVSWDGREDFASGHPHVEFAPGAPTGQNTGNQATGVLPSTGLLGALGGIAILLAGVVVVARRRGYGLGGGTTVGGGASTTSSADGGSSAASGVGRGGGGAGDGSAAAGGAAGSSTSISPDKKDRELLADVDKVQRVLERAGGRMKQSEIGDELEWSKAKTSRVLSRLEDDGEIEKLRLGRENVIDLAGDDGSDDQP